jgi:ATP/maltotriose-dependent transcriptional regulator MalT
MNTVKAHTRAIYAKLDANSRLEAVATARSLELIA